MTFSKKHSIYLLSITVLLTTIISFVLPEDETPERAQQVQAHVDIQEKTEPAPAPQITNFKPKKRPGFVKTLLSPNYEENPFSGEETKARLTQISDSFREDIKYPTTSKPIQDEDSLQKYLPNRSIASSVAISPRDEQSPKISIKSSKHQYFRGEDIHASAYFEGLSDRQTLSVSGRLVQAGKLLSQAEIIPNAQDRSRFDLKFNDLPDQEIHPERGARIVAQFNVDNRSYEIGTAISYVASVARVDHVDNAQIDNEYLSIPVYISTTSPGYHRLSAILYAAETGTPLLSLNAEKDLQTNNDFIPLKAHIASLKTMGHEGPYTLREFSLTRMPSKPNFRTEHGVVERESFDIQGFPFSEYQDIPFEDEQAQARVEFLTQLGSTK